jgi:hypothetical protein
MFDSAALPGSIHPTTRGVHRPFPWAGIRAGALSLVVLAAALVRIHGLAAAGFAEDEMDKLNAAESYARGDFAYDGEHPALMKLAVLASVGVARWRNAHTGTPLRTIPIEAAVRLPNALAGAALTIVIYLLVTQWFSPMAGLLAAWLWAFDVNAIAINRIAKEETFVLLFLLMAAYAYERGKRAGPTDPTGAQAWFAASGAAFGLLLASKYVPFLIGIHILFFRAADPRPGRNRANKLVHFGTMGIAFLAANFAVLLPGNLMSIRALLTEHGVLHTGYVFHGRLWPNTVSLTESGGLPIWFYAVGLLTKVPLAVLVAGVAGIMLLARTRGRGPLFVLTFLALTLVPYSVVAVKFLRYMLPTLAMIDIAAAVAAAGMVSTLRLGRSGPATKAAYAAAITVVLAAPVLAWSSARTFPSLYRNAVGQHLSPHALWFPPDELYDAGLREAVGEVALRAHRSATIVTDAPSVVSFYLVRFGRPDVEVVRTSANRPRPDDWFIVQDGRVYFENQKAVREARRTAPEIKVDVGGFPAAEVYRAALTASRAR